jgi:hypothetical protein
METDGLHFAALAGWQSGYAAVCNTVYAGSIPTPASINSSLVNQSVYESSKTRSYRLKTPVFSSFWLKTSIRLQAMRIHSHPL